jgi:precorrin-6x reductase
MALMLPPSDLKLSNNHLINIYEATKYITKASGYQGLFKGLAAASLKAGIGCFIYFTILRTLEKPNQNNFQDFLLSSFSRIASTFFTNALNII